MEKSMNKPLEITFRNLDRSETLAAVIEDKCRQLERFYRHIISMHVMVEAPYKRQHKGKRYCVTIETRLSGRHLVTSRSPAMEIRQTELLPTVNDAFRAMARKLEDYFRRQRGDAKHHELPAQGRIARIFPEQGYGFIILTDGQEIYFHKNSVTHKAFITLEQDTPVRVVLDETESQDVPQASTVEPVSAMRILNRRNVSAG
jgi:cold shock CspA family protein